jgi:serine/threonine protein kinase
MDSPYLIKLYHVEEDKNFIYLLTEYCEGGDLSVYLGRLMTDVFSIDQAS